MSAAVAPSRINAHMHPAKRVSRQAQKRKDARANRQLVSEIVGRTSNIFPPTRYYAATTTTVDRTVPDYQWWSAFRRGKQPGYEFGSMFAKPIEDIIAGWVIGDGFTAKTGVEDTDGRIAQFVTQNLATLLTAYKDMLGHGDAYIIVQPDGTLAMASPDTVEQIDNPVDYRDLLGYKITTKLEKVTITDEYRADVRVVTMRTSDSKNMAFTVSGFDYFTGKPLPPGTTQTAYMNPMGRIPVIHWAFGKGVNETNGHPVYEALLHWFKRYNDLIEKSLDGAEVMGRPIPVAYVENPTQAQEDNKTRDEVVNDKDGTSHTVPVVDFNNLDMLWLKAVPGAKFEFAAPGSFSADSVALLKKLFYIMLEHTGIPEWVWGGAIASSKASVDAQMPAFVRLVNGWRTMLGEGLLELIETWLLTVSFFEPVTVTDEISLTWPSVSTKDERLVLDKVKHASENSLVTKATELRLLGLVPDEDVDEEVEAAAQEAQDEQDAFNETVAAKMNEMNQDDNGDPNADTSQENADAEYAA